jgi:Sec-independent protein secretion pathway component TatC
MSVHCASREIWSLCIDVDGMEHRCNATADTAQNNAAAGSQSSSDGKPTALQNILSPDPSELPDDFNMPIWDHLEELRERWVLTGPLYNVGWVVQFNFGCIQNGQDTDAALLFVAQQLVGMHLHCKCARSAAFGFCAAQTTSSGYTCSVLVGALAALVAIIVCFCFSKDLVVFLEAPVATKGVRFLQLSPGEFFFTTFKVTPAVQP